ncbi:MAG: SufE family protein [Xanthomonadales bacterium]|nr:SufE family protein [Xanthomonadales bacterium]
MSERIDQLQDDIVDEFSFFDDWLDRYQYIIDLGRKLPEFPEHQKTEDNRLHGCQSQVWLLASGDAERLDFQAVSDSAIVCGLIALVMRVYSGHSAREILNLNPYFIEKIGLNSHLSPTRSNGLHAMLQALRGYAESALAGEPG